MKKLISVSMLAAWLLSGGVAFASVGVQDSDSSELGPVMSLKEGTGMTFTVSNGVLTVGGGAVGSDGNWTSDGLAVSLDLAPTKFIATASSGDFAATGFTVGTGDITFAQGGKLDGDTNGTLKLIEASDTLSFIFSGTTIQLDSSDGGFQFALSDATEGQVDFLTNNDTDDYMVVKTASNVPTIATLGTSNLAIVPDGGTVAITGAVTVTSSITPGTLIIGDETFSVPTDDTIRIASNDAATIWDIYTPGTANEDAVLRLSADASADNGDDWQIVSDGATNSLLLQNDTGGSQATILTLSTAGVLTTTGDVVIAGTTPLITVGDAGAEDAAIVYDGNAQDFYIGLDDSVDDLIIGLGSTLGTTPIISMTDVGHTTVTGSTDGILTVWGAGTSASDAYLRLVGDAQADASDSFEMFYDSSAGTLYMGIDSTAAGTYITKATLASTGAMTVQGSEATAGSFAIWADNGDDTADKLTVSVADGGATTVSLGSESPVTIGATGAVGIAKMFVLPTYRASLMPASAAASAASGAVVSIHDARSAQDCGNIGGGATINVCISNGTNWVDF